MNTKLHEHFDALEQLRRNDDGSSVVMKELDRILGEFKYDVWVETNDRRLKELGMKEVME